MISCFTTLRIYFLCTSVLDSKPIFCSKLLSCGLCRVVVWISALLWSQIENYRKPKSCAINHFFFMLEVSARHGYMAYWIVVSFSPSFDRLTLILVSKKHWRCLTVLRSFSLNLWLRKPLLNTLNIEYGFGFLSQELHQLVSMKGCSLWACRLNRIVCLDSSD